ncbi:MAG: DUF3881 family protein [Lachnospiraceae bacterium]|nr:DUF3881 family protein [Lachnospiraceae bacterium]
MHRFLRAIGYSKIKNRKDINSLVVKSVQSANTKMYVNYDEELFAEYKTVVAEGNGATIGLCVRGALESDHHLLCDYYFPYLKGRCISSAEEISIEKHLEKTAYAGAIDELMTGLTLIFYLQDAVPYMKRALTGNLPKDGAKLCLTGLSDDGMILFPIEKTPEDQRIAVKQQIRKARMIAKARSGDEEAMESLTASDVDICQIIQEKIKDEEDVLSLVDTSIIPYGLECDLYTIIGEIVTVDLLTNPVTEEKVYVMALSVNDVPMDICINEEDLMGEPAVGRRFKGTVWLQGSILWP